MMEISNPMAGEVVHITNQDRMTKVWVVENIVNTRTSSLKQPD